MSVFDAFSEFFTAWMNMSAEKYPAASASDPFVPGLNASTSSLNCLTPGESASNPANCRNTYAPVSEPSRSGE